MVLAMRAALVMEDVLAGDPGGATVLQRLLGVDVQPIVVARRAPGDTTKIESGGLRLVIGPEGSGDPLPLLAEAANAADAALSEAFLVCAKLGDAAAGLDHGCRVLLVLGDRTLDEVLGPEEPARKSLGVAADLGAAVHYMIGEAHEDQQLGPFPFGQPKVEERATPRLPSSGDLARIFVLVVIAGVAVALGIAYLLREVYQTVTFPSEAYWLTLQFIPRAWRGLLFVVIGTSAGLAAGYALARLRYR
jgi:hypothetical protein